MLGHAVCFCFLFGAHFNPQKSLSAFVKCRKVLHTSNRRHFACRLQGLVGMIRRSLLWRPLLNLCLLIYVAHFLALLAV